MIELIAARTAIEPVEDILVEGMLAGGTNWKTLLDERPDLAAPLNARTRANFIHNHGCTVISQRAETVDGVRIADGLGFFAMLVGDEILLRVKFVGYGAPSNVSTEQQRRLARQTFTPEMMGTLDGIAAPPTLLTCGYTLEGADINRIEIRRECVGHQPWSYDIYGGEAVSEPLIIPGLADTTKPAIVTSTRREAVDGRAHAKQA
jgi:hypothetical protein